MTEEKTSPCIHPYSSQQLSFEMNCGGKYFVSEIDGVEETFCYSAVEEQTGERKVDY